MAWLLIGSALLLAGSPSGRWTVAVAAWLAPLFVIRFVRHETGPAQLLLGSAILVIANSLPWFGVAPGQVLPWVVGPLFLLPYAMDRVLAPRLGGLAGSLVFPLSWAVLDFVNALADPLGSWGSLAYTQYGDLPLMQLASVTGLPGLTFLVAWFGSLANLVWERGLDHREVRRGAALFGAVLGSVLLYGGARLLVAIPRPGTVRVSGITAIDRRELQAQLGGALASDRQRFRESTRAIHDRYLQQTVRQAQGGSKIVVWAEATVVAEGEDEERLIARGRETAREQGIYLAMALLTFGSDSKRPLENKLILAAPSGEVVLQHEKYGGSFIEGTRPGDRALRTTSSPYGTLSGVLCWDMDFPRTIHQASRNGTDIMLVPSSDWREIDPIHTEMAVFRAIEDGFSLVRQAQNGLSLATDFAGRPLGSMDHFTASEWVLTAQLPIAGIRTPYGLLGDLFGWLASLGLLALGSLALVGKGGRRPEPSPPAAQARTVAAGAQRVGT
jgi:apolipoprotein N-acyltransferase